MAVEVLTGCQVTVGNVDLSDHCRSVTIDDAYEEKENTVMSHAAKSTMGGIPTPSIKLRLLQDYAAGKTHETLRPLVKTNVAIIIRRTTAIRSGTNPEWQLTGYFGSYQPIAGSPGDLQEVEAEFKSAGTAMSYLTTST